MTTVRTALAREIEAGIRSIAEQRDYWRTRARGLEELLERVAAVLPDGDLRNEVLARLGIGDH